MIGQKQAPRGSQNDRNSKLITVKVKVNNKLERSEIHHINNDDFVKLVEQTNRNHNKDRFFKIMVILPFTWIFIALLSGCEYIPIGFSDDLMKYSVSALLMPFAYCSFKVFKR